MSLPDEVYTYWDQLEIIKELDDSTGKKIGKKKIRGYILDAISRGVLDEINGNKKRRRALTVNEIYSLIVEKYDIEIKKTSLYYHIQVMMDLNLLQEVTSVKEGNIITSYFGRTTKLILFDYQPDEEGPDHTKKLPQQLSILTNPEFKKFLQRMRAKQGLDDIDVDQLVNDLVINYQKIYTDLGRNFTDWIKNLATELHGLDLNLIELHPIYKEIRTYNSQITVLLETMERLLQLDQEIEASNVSI